MQAIHWIASLVFGSVIGSFLNVCIHRLPRGDSLVFPGSHCPKCGAPIKWFDNLPMVSYVILRGRCRSCKGVISPRYPIVEMISAGLCLVLFRQYGISAQFGIYYAFVSALVVVTFIDLDHLIIPNEITYAGIPAGVAASVLIPRMSLVDSLVGILVGGGGLMLFALAFEWIRKKEGMGFGDVKLLAMIGAFLGWKGVVLTVLFSSIVGAVVGFSALRLSGKGTDHPIPYGPFLAMGAIVHVLWGEALLGWYLSIGVSP